jgi:hypothetical protein
MLLKRAGLFSGDTKKGDKWNKRGYFENVAISNLEIEYLRINDTDGLLKRFQPLDLKAQFPSFRSKVIQALESEGLQDNIRWFYKNPKTAMCWRLWDQSFPSAQWVIVTRNRVDSLRSLHHTEFMDAYGTSDEWERFLDYYDVLFSRIRANCDSFTLDIDRVFCEGVAPVAELFEFIGDLSADNVLECVEPNLWHYGNSGE